MDPHYQSFDMPMAMMNYISKSWTPKAYEKLIQTCKYFFFHHRIVTIDKFVLYTDFEYNDDYYDQGDDGYYFMDDKLVYKTWEDDPVSFDLNNKKIWVTGTFYTGVSWTDSGCPPERLDNTSLLLKYIYRCDVTHLELREQTLTSNELAFMIKSVEWLDLYDNKFTFPDGRRLTYGDLLLLTPKLQFLKCCCDQFISSITVHDGRIPTLKNIEKIRLMDVNLREFVGYEDWCQFIKIHRREVELTFTFNYKEDTQADTNPLREAITEAFPETEISKHILFEEYEIQGLLIKFKGFDDDDEDDLY